jgi:hypothetical protein
MFTATQCADKLSEYADYATHSAVEIGSGCVPSSLKSGCTCLRRQDVYVCPVRALQTGNKMSQNLSRHKKIKRTTSECGVAPSLSIHCIDVLRQGRSFRLLRKAPDALYHLIVTT